MYLPRGVDGGRPEGRRSGTTAGHLGGELPVHVATRQAPGRPPGLLRHPGVDRLQLLARPRQGAGGRQIWRPGKPGGAIQPEKHDHPRPGGRAVLPDIHLGRRRTRLSENGDNQSLHDNYEMVKNAIASYLDQNNTQIEKTDKVFFSITLSSQSDLNSDEFVSAVNVINAAIFEYMRFGDGVVSRKREHRLNAPDNLIRGVHASVGLIKKACNYELKSDVFNIVINHLTKHDEGPETYLQYLLVDGKEDK